LEMAPGEGRENRLKAYLSAIKDDVDYDFIIIDTPPTPSVWMTSRVLKYVPSFVLRFSNEVAVGFV